jgi:hypothetical protein
VGKRRDRRNHNLRIASGAILGPFDAYLQIRIDSAELLFGLEKQFLAMRQNEQPLFHLERARKMREYDGLSRPCRQGDQHPALPAPVGVPYAGKRFRLIIAQVEHRSERIRHRPAQKPVERLRNAVEDGGMAEYKQRYLFIDLLRFVAAFFTIQDHVFVRC